MLVLPVSVCLARHSTWQEACLSACLYCVCVCVCVCACVREPSPDRFLTPNFFARDKFLPGIPVEPF